MKKIVMLLAILLSLFFQACDADSVNINKLNRLEKRCERIFFETMKSPKYRDYAIRFLSFSTNRLFFNSMSRVFDDRNLSVTRKKDIVFYVSTLSNSEEWLYKIFANNKSNIIKYRALGFLLDKKSKLIDINQVKKEFMQFGSLCFKKASITAAADYGSLFNMLLVMKSFNKMFFKKEMLNEFMKTDSISIAHAIYDVFEHYKFQTMNAFILMKLDKIDQKKQWLMAHILVSMLKPEFGFSKKVIHYLNKQISLGSDSSNFDACVQSLQRFYPEKDIIGKYFKIITDDVDKVNYINSSLRQGLVKKENRLSHIRFLIDKVVNPHKGHTIISAIKRKITKYNNARILNGIYRYENDYPEITEIALKILESKNYKIIIDFLMHRKLKVNEFKYVIPLLKENLIYDNKVNPKIFRLIVARSILFSIYDYKRKVSKTIK